MYIRNAARITASTFSGAAPASAFTKTVGKAIVGMNNKSVTGVAN